MRTSPVPCILLILAALLVLPLPAAAQQLAVGPLMRTLHVSDGSGAIDVTVRNTRAERADISVDVNDWAVDSAGQHTFRPAGTYDYSCGERLVPSRRALALEPGDSATVRLTFHGDGVATCRNIVFFRVTETPEVLGGDRLIISTGVKVYVEPAPGGTEVDEPR